MTKLSVNINKIATLRNARGHDNPNVLAWAKKIEHWGAQGITVHPRPDERHILSQKVDYIHNNPLQPKWNLAVCAEDYPWSSAGYYVNNTNTFPFLTTYFD